MTQSKTIPLGRIGTNDIESMELFVIEENNVFMPALVMTTFGSFTASGRDILYTNGSWTDLKQHGGLINTFAKDSHFHLYFWKDGNICIHKLMKDGGLELVTSIGIVGSSAEHTAPGTIMNVIPVPGTGNSYYLSASQSVSPIHPVEFLKNIISGGHGIYYVKPILIEVQDGKIGKSQKLRYGGKRDETYYIRKVVPRGDLVHFLGIRQQERPASGTPKKKFTPVILHHFAYDLKKKKVTQTNPIYTATPRFEKNTRIRYYYGDITIDALGDNVFVTFSWQKRTIETDQYIESNILYWDYNQGNASEVEKIADGFLPIVKADSLGNVHLIYVNNEANLMHKVKRKGVWQQEDVLVDRVDTKPYIENIAVAFDKDNNLHVVYPLGGKLVHAKVKLD